MKRLFYSFMLIGALFLTGCADAGKDQKVQSEASVQLDASKSTASVGGKLKRYYWRQVRGPRVTLSNARAIQTSFVAPTVTKSTVLVFKLTTLEFGGKISPFRTRDYISITVEPNTTTNQAPNAVASVSQSTVKEGESVTFDASASTDSDGSIAGYEWKDAEGTLLSTEATFSHEFAQSGEHTVTLTVTDDDGATSSSQVSVKVNALVKPIAVANASTTQTVIGAEVTFNADGSSDADGEIVNYQWIDSNGNILSNEATFTHTFDTSGEYNITLEVMDDDEQITTSSVSIVIAALLEEVSVSSEVQTLVIGESTSLSAFANYNDGTSQTVTSEVNWTVSDTSVATIDENGVLTAVSEGTVEVSANIGEVASAVVSIDVVLPADTTPPVITVTPGTDSVVEGSTFTDAGATATDDRDGTVTVTVSGNVDTNKAGTYTLTYTAVDAAGNTATATRTVTVTQAPDTTAPVIDLHGGNVTLTVGDTYTETATASDNKDGDITANIVRIGEIDTETAGTYTLTYNVEDAAGNVADEVSRVVMVEEGNILQCVDATFVLTNSDIWNGLVEYEIQFHTIPTEDISIELSTDFTIIGPNSSGKATPVDDSELSVTVPAGTTLYSGSVAFNIPHIDPLDSVGYELRMENPLCDDTTKPIINLNGEENMTIIQGNPYIEEGATATDDRDGTVTVTVSGNVDTNKAGTYTLTYTAVDAAGNTATATRTVTVTQAPDTTPPVINLNGGDVTLTVGDTYTELATASDNKDGDITANIVRTGNVDTTTAGTYTLTYNVSDAAGNAAVTQTRTVTVVDNTPVPVVDANFSIDLAQVPGYSANDPIEDQYLSVINYLRGLRIKCNDPSALEGPVGIDLSWNTFLTDASQEHSDDMLITGLFSHDGSGLESDITGQTFTPVKASSPFERMIYNGYNYSTAGENIAYRAAYPTLAEDAWVQAMEGWMTSDTGHCSNIMNPNFRDFGMAEARGPYDFGTVIGEGAYWTQNFGAQ